MKERSSVAPVLVLDGPSALAVYRDRDDLQSNMRLYGKVDEPAIRLDRDAEDFWLSDEDVAASLTDVNVLGHLATTEADDRLAASSEGLPELVRCSMTRMRGAATRSRELKQMPYESTGVRPPAEASPLYILVPQSERRRTVRFVRQRLCRTALPAHSFWRLGKQVYVPTAEFTFLLMAHYLNLHELMALGMELCGHYRLAGASTHRPLASNRTLYEQRPLTTPRRIASLLERADGLTGLPLAKRAVGYLAASSASPMESALYLLLCLPRKLGGYGLPCPQLNARRRVTGRAGSFTLSKTLVPDLFWPGAFLDVEYDSEEFHASEEALEKGARRTLALRSMGVEVVSVTKEVVYDEDSFDALARLVAKALGARVRRPAQAGERQRELLRQTLLYSGGRQGGASL